MRTGVSDWVQTSNRSRPCFPSSILPLDALRTPQLTGLKEALRHAYDRQTRRLSLRARIVLMTPSYMLAIADEFERQGIDPRDTAMRRMAGITGRSDDMLIVRG